MTLPEVLLWQEIRKQPEGFRFRRQYPCQGYVVDFACLKRRLAIEIDGEAHSMGDRPARDVVRDAALAEFGFNTLRIAARDVLKDLDAVVAYILTACASRPLHRSAALSGPPPRSGEDHAASPTCAIPPRNGEGDRSKNGGGAEPPRSGEGF